MKPENLKVSILQWLDLNEWFLSLVPEKFLRKDEKLTFLQTWLNINLLLHPVFPQTSKVAKHHKCLVSASRCFHTFFKDISLNIHECGLHILKWSSILVKRNLLIIIKHIGNCSWSYLKSMLTSDTNLPFPFTFDLQSTAKRNYAKK